METLEIQLATDSKGRPRSCPRCGSLLAEIADKQLCVSCSYNRRKAKLAVWRQTIIGVFWVLIWIAVGASIPEADARTLIWGFAALLAILHGVNLKRAWRAFRKVESGAYAGLRSAEPKVEPAPVDVGRNNLVPREVHPTWRARTAFAFLLILPAFAYVFVHFRHPSTLLVGGVVGVLFAALCFRLWNHHGLVRNGELVVAVVLEETPLKYGEYRITYEFTDCAGMHRRRRFIDSSGELQEGKKFELYVDAKRGWRCVPKNSAWFRAVETVNPASPRAIE